jgi:hypothetical protein
MPCRAHTWVIVQFSDNHSFTKKLRFSATRSRPKAYSFVASSRERTKSVNHLPGLLFQLCPRSGSLSNPTACALSSILTPLRGSPCAATNPSQRLNAEVKVEINGDGQECPSRRGNCHSESCPHRIFYSAAYCCEDY